MAYCSVCPAYAVTVTAKAGEPKSIIEGMKVRQVGSSQVMLELRGTSISLPVQGPTTGSAITLIWRDIRFPRNTVSPGTQTGRTGGTNTDGTCWG